MSRVNLIDKWRSDGCKYKRGDIVVFGQWHYCVLFDAEITMDCVNTGGYPVFEEDGPWGVYSTNKHPSRKRCEIVKLLYHEFTKEFGTVFGVVNIYNGNHWSQHRPGGNQWNANKSLTIKKSYI